jgi:CHAD domain-containing protein
VLAGDPAAVHRIRVSSRRLREALAIVDAGLDRGAVRRLRKSVRGLARALGPLREAHVTRQELETARDRHRWTFQQVGEIRRALRRENARRRLGVAAALGRLRVRSMVRHCREVAESVHDSGADGPAWWPLVRARASARARGVESAIAACGTRYAPELLHQLRLAAKKLRYTMELVPRGMGAAACLRRLRAVQRRLGHLHDVQVLIDEIEVIAGSDPDAAAYRITPLVDALERDCRSIHAVALSEMSSLGEQVAANRRMLTAGARGRRRPARRTTRRTG